MAFQQWALLAVLLLCVPARAEPGDDCSLTNRQPRRVRACSRRRAAARRPGERELRSRQLGAKGECRWPVPGVQRPRCGVGVGC